MIGEFEVSYLLPRLTFISVTSMPVLRWSVCIDTRLLIILLFRLVAVGTVSSWINSFRLHLILLCLDTDNYGIRSCKSFLSVETDALSPLASP